MFPHLPEIAPDSRAALDALIGEMPNYGSEFTGTFANHAPMVLIAQAFMGGSPAQMQRFFAEYNAYKGLLPFADSDLTITVETWQAHLGAREHEAAYRRFFDAELHRLGLHDMLRLWLPRMAPGVGASAFHALMRMAYALMNDEDAVEASHALAYWCATWLQMPAQTGTAPLSANPAEVLIYAGGLPGVRDQEIYPLIWQNMRQAMALPGFETAGDWLEVDDTVLERCAAASVVLFAATQDFCALHALTGMHWIRVLQPYHAATNEMVRAFWAGAVGLMNEMGFPELPPPEALERWRALPCPDWPEIFAAACQSFDEHDLSVTFSCSQEEQIYGDPLYRRAAARRLGLIGEMTV
jgi:hypothetical protein